ncbi:hypothetical protein M3Y98_00976500 [Aphelenchoides besseyi]|nr:hypothetical protein M3Y98_00976500 [Aphelenchoides besseyi]
MNGMPSMIPGLHPAAVASKTTNGMPMMNPHFMQQQLAAQMMMMNPMVSSAFPTQQLPPELLALVANVAACGGNPMDALNLMQNPAMLAKLYADYAAYIQVQQQQQLQAILAQQQAQTMQPPPKKRATPTVRTPTTTDKSLADPLTSLQNMVNPRNVPPTSSPAVKSEVVMPIVIEDEVKDEVIIVDDEIKSNEANVVPASATVGSAFSIAEILQNANDLTEQHLISNTPTNRLSAKLENADSASTISPPANDSNIDSQLSDATDSLSGRSTQSNSKFVKKTSIVGVNKCAQRKGHIEYHRRMKGINARCKCAQCQLCGEVVANNSSELTRHVYSHSLKPLFGCVNCDSCYNQKVDLFRHSSNTHPNVKDHDKFMDLRDMSYLCDLLEKCFPRNSKLVVDTLLNRLIKTCEGNENLHCRVCEKDVPANITSLKNHLTQHPRYRCKLCHFTSDDEEVQRAHGQHEHREAVDSSSNTNTLYNITSAANVLSGVLTTCFGNYMPADQLEFAEEMSVMDRVQDSPQET